MNVILPFHVAMADFADREAAMERRGGIGASLLPSLELADPLLDCACGIGTPILALARPG